MAALAAKRGSESHVAMEKPHPKIAKSAILEWDTRAVPRILSVLFSSFGRALRRTVKLHSYGEGEVR